MVFMFYKWKEIERFPENLHPEEKKNIVIQPSYTILTMFKIGD